MKKVLNRLGYYRPQPQVGITGEGNAGLGGKTVVVHPGTQFHAEFGSVAADLLRHRRGDDLRGGPDGKERLRDKTGGAITTGCAFGPDGTVVAGSADK